MTKLNPYHLKKPQQLLQLFGKTCKAARTQKKWRQEDLAERINVTRQTVARLEKGDPTIAAGVYFAVAWILDIPIFGNLEIENNKAQNILHQFLELLNEESPKRIAKQKEKPIDDKF